ncbi:MAG: isoprenylcysteine carboxylmethyltransferase family protein [Calditrichaeota bacterium]|nr:isoprenylcysteine carboxylmethyltransferase family protein [Calditrichota bacterium]RQW01721.1 MAG: isoprenylcysteine carboxylmethyltransferase family protein [Calditrichota bacterium]
MDLRQFVFKYRGFTPVPIILVVIIFAQPSVWSILAGLIIMMTGEFIRIWGVSYAGGATRTRHVGAPQLVTGGPFAHVRNPLYVGNMIMYTGAALMANIWLPWLILAVWLFFSLQYILIVKLEEEELEKIFGSEYLRYKESVPRFLPRRTPLRGKNSHQPDYLMALRSEKSTFISFMTILLLMLAKMWLF